MSRSTSVRVLVAFATLVTMMSVGTAGAAPSDRAPDVVGYWTPERMANATPRDLFVDQRGLGYIRSASGGLEPYGHDIAAMVAPLRAVPEPNAPGGGGGGGTADTTGPTVTGLDPDGSEPIAATYTFSATITDDSGLKSVSFEVGPAGGLTQKFTPSNSGDAWSITIEGFTATANPWQWRVIAKDGAGRGGNTTTEPWVEFTVDTGGSVTPPTPPPSGDVVSDANWDLGGAVAEAAGRIYFEMPGNAKWKGPWNGYVCSGTVVNDGVGGRSVIITAAHCVYDDANKAFARNVLFIPQQQETSGSGTDLNCNNDPIGCWAPSFGVVDLEWTNKTFPDNIPWDFAYYVVDDTDAGASKGSDANGDPLDGGDPLDVAVTPLGIEFGDPGNSATTDAIGYSYSQDPALRYCSENLGKESSYGDLWLGSCDLSGGSSGGPWQQGFNDGDGAIISVNSWGYTNQSGMAGPILDAQASCLFGVATNDWVDSAPDGAAGLNPDC